MPICGARCNKMENILADFETKVKNKIAALERASADAGMEIKRLEAVRRELQYEKMMCAWWVNEGQTVIQKGSDDPSGF